jgi:hypothetical protein
MSRAYSDSYRDARSRFRAAARNIGAELEAQLVQGAPDSDQNLTIDIARVGAPNPAWSVVVSSGLHGVEGLMGSAIQIAALEQLTVPDLVQAGGAHPSLSIEIKRFIWHFWQSSSAVPIITISPSEVGASCVGCSFA